MAHKIALNVTMQYIKFTTNPVPSDYRKCKTQNDPSSGLRFGQVFFQKLELLNFPSIFNLDAQKL